ncbi:hypothetical protein TNCV_4246251 [Trichonephila clavipes]|nr:hypothetical protein TNCV_4246251 [Trichonephila clavipes]
MVKNLITLSHGQVTRAVTKLASQSTPYQFEDFEPRQILRASALLYGGSSVTRTPSKLPHHPPNFHSMLT